MATWKSENSMLTKVGVDILNKAKSGIGSILVTKIVAGSGRVPESKLYTQTSISGKQKNFTIASRRLTETGSEISIYISNEDFTESYELNQIGIYVRHPEYSGEQLYHISQCNAEDFDTIPSFSDTPVTYNFTLHLEHGNSSSIEITIDPDGMLRKEVFENFRKNAVAGNLLTFDENMNLIDTGIPVSKIGSASRNMAHNPFLCDPVDSKKGRIAIAGTPYYSDTSLETQVGTLTGALLVTYVNDSYCTIVVGGVTRYVRTFEVKYGYLADSSTPCIDRWFLYKGLGSGHIVNNYDGAIITLGKGGGKFYQEVASAIGSAHFGGHNYTFSAKIVSVTGGTPVLTFDNGEETLKIPITEAGLVSVTTYVAEDSGAFAIGIQNDHTSESCTLQVHSVKLEVGNSSTLEQDPPADYAEQMAICIQYDPTSDMYRGFDHLTTTNILATASITE